MNVARKSTAKLPQCWSQTVHCKDEEADSGIGSADFTDLQDSVQDSFQQAILNIKSVNGMCDLSESRVKKSVQKENKVEPNGDEGSIKDKDILDQIDSIVSDQNQTVKNGDRQGLAKGLSDVGSDENDVVVVKEDTAADVKDKRKNLSDITESTGDLGSKLQKLKFGEKIRNSVKHFVSKLAQSGIPEVNTLLSKPKSEDFKSDTSLESLAVQPSRHDKGNLFDNLDLNISNTEALNSVSATEETVGDQLSREQQSAEVKSALCGKKKDKEENPVLDVDRTSVHDGYNVSSKVDSNISQEDHTSQGDIRNLSESQDLHTEANVSLENTDTSYETKDGSGATKVDENLFSSAINDMDGSKSKNTTDTSSCQNNSNEPSDVNILCKSVSHEEQGDSADTMAEGVAPTGCESEDDDDVNDRTNTLCDKDKKRQLEGTSNVEDALPPKRSRLDLVIGKLGEKIGIPPEAVETENFDYEDSMQEDSESAEKQSEEVSGSASEDEDEDRASVSSSSTKTLRISNKDLEALIHSKIMSQFPCQHEAELQALQSQVEALTKSQEEWRKMAKDLERQVLEMTVVQQRLEKRKAHTAALRSITTRNMSVQVNEDKLRSNTPQKLVSPKTPPRVASAGNTPIQPSAPPVTSMVLLTPASQLNSSPVTALATSVVNDSKGTSMNIGHNLGSRNTSMAQLLSHTAHMPTAANTVASNKSSLDTGNSGSRLQLLPRTLCSTPVRSLLEKNKPNTTASLPGANLVLVNASDLSLNSKTVVPSTLPGPTLLPAPTSNATLAAPGIKVIDLTLEDEANAAAKQMQLVSPSGQIRGMVPQQMVRQLTPLTPNVHGPTSTILLSSPSGTQIVNAQNMPRPPVLHNLQVVTIPNAQNLRPGSLVTVVTGQPNLVRQAAPSLTTNCGPRPQSQVMPTPATSVAVMRPAHAVGLNNLSHPSPTATVTATRLPVTLTPVPPATVSSPQLQPSDLSGTNSSSKALAKNNRFATRAQHPAPLPPAITRLIPGELKSPPPQPGLKISRVKQGIVLSWNMTLPKNCIEIASYQLYAYQETNAVPQSSLWKKVGDVKALPLPMACTLTQFQDGNKYHFAVRATDIHGRTGLFSDPAYIFLSKS